MSNLPRILVMGIQQKTLVHNRVVFPVVLGNQEDFRVTVGSVVWVVCNRAKTAPSGEWKESKLVN